MSFPEDVIHEILIRLKKDVGALFRCASTCKRWRRLVAEARGGPDHTPSSFLSGFFVRKRIGVFCTDRSSMTSLVPTPQWAIKPHRRLLGSFFPETAAGGRLGRAVPLAARHGLLLARLPSGTEKSRSRGRSTDHLVVCNLLAGTWEVLPPLESSWEYRERRCRTWKYGDTGYTIFTEAVADLTSDHPSNVDRQSSTPSGYSPLFKVLVIYTSGRSLPCILNTFSSGEARWNTPIDIDGGTGKVGTIGPLKHPNAVVCRGTAHWLVSCSGGLHTVGVDVETGHATVTKIVILDEQFSDRACDEPQLGVATDGTLSLLYLQRRAGLRLNVFVRQDQGGSVDGGLTGWLLSRVVELKPPEEGRTSIQGEAADLTFIGVMGGTVLVRDQNMLMYAADLETGRKKEVTFCGQVNRWKVVPFEIYWPTS